ncbi:MAG: DUF5685 family protein [Clostridiales bacterium]|nr:DUF5685 family protein [Clostridiales bacterium]
MFGYVTPVLSALGEEQKLRYRSFYCGVCHALRDRHGQVSRLSLSNDMTFLALLLSSLYEPETAVSGARCGPHPLKPHTFLSSPMIDYAADMNALLFYYKCEDQRLDDHSLKGKAGKSLFRKAAEDVKHLWPVQAKGVENALTELWKEEANVSPDPDRLCNLSGEMLGAVFVPKQEDPWGRVLRSVGCGLGRFIYWMDAWEDYDEDIRKRRFNPLATWHDRPDYGDFCRETLELLIADAAESFEILPLEQDLDILRNVIYSGVWQRYCLITERKNRKEESHGK